MAVQKAYAALVTQASVFPENTGLSASRISDTIATMEKYKTLTGGTAPAESSLVRGRR